MSYLEEIILSRDGDFNLRVNDRDNHDASLLLDLLETHYYCPSILKSLPITLGTTFSEGQ